MHVCVLFPASATSSSPVTCGPLPVPPALQFALLCSCRLFLSVPPPSQVHYDNPEGLTGVVDDSSAVLLHLTDTPRRLEAGTINIGDPFVTLGGQVVESGRNYTIKCPSECTSQLAEPLTVYDSFLHAHRTALYLFTNQFRNNTLLRTLEGSQYWYVRVIHGVSTFGSFLGAMRVGGAGSSRTRMGGMCRLCAVLCVCVIEMLTSRATQRPYTCLVLLPFLLLFFCFSLRSFV